MVLVSLVLHMCFILNSRGLRDAMQGLDFHGWLDMLEVVFRNVLQTLKRMKV